MSPILLECDLEPGGNCHSGSGPFVRRPALSEQRIRPVIMQLWSLLQLDSWVFILGLWAAAVAGTRACFDGIKQQHDDALLALEATHTCAVA